MPSHRKWVIALVCAVGAALVMLLLATRSSVRPPQVGETAAEHEEASPQSAVADRVAVPAVEPPMATSEATASHSVCGMVVDRASGIGIEGATVCVRSCLAPYDKPLLGAAIAEPRRITVTTDAEGRFAAEVADLALRTLLSVEHASYERWTSLPLAAGQPLAERVDLGHIALQRLADTSISVVTENGDPVAGAHLYWWPAPAFERSTKGSQHFDEALWDRPRATSDAAGIAVVPSKPGQALRLVVLASARAPAYYRRLSLPAQASFRVVLHPAGDTDVLVTENDAPLGIPCTVTAWQNVWGVLLRVEAAAAHARFPPLWDSETSLVRFSAEPPSKHGLFYGAVEAKSEAASIVLPLTRSVAPVRIIWDVPDDPRATLRPMLLGAVRIEDNGDVYTEAVQQVDAGLGSAMVIPETQQAHYVTGYCAGLGFGRTEIFTPVDERTPRRLEWHADALRTCDLTIRVRAGGEPVRDAVVRGTFAIPRSVWPQDVSRFYAGGRSYRIPGMQHDRRLVDQDWQFAVEQRTDRAGAAVFAGIPCGHVSVEAAHPSAGNGRVEADLAASPQAIEVDLAVLGSVRGRVEGTLFDVVPRQDLEVSLGTESGDRVTLLDGEGRFAFAQVAPGRHVLRVTIESPRWWQARGMLDITGLGFMYEPRVVLHEAELQVAADQATEHRIRIDDAEARAGVTLRFRDRTGPVQLCVTPLTPYFRPMGNARAYCAEVDRDEVAIVGLGTGRVVLEARATDATIWWRVIELGRGPHEFEVGRRAYDVAVPTAGAPPQDVREVELVARTARADFAWLTFSAERGSDGSFAAHAIPDGDYAVRVRTDLGWRDAGELTVAPAR